MGLNLANISWQDLRSERKGARGPNICPRSGREKPSSNLVWEGGVTHSPVDIFNQCDLSSERIAPMKGSEQPLADGATGVLAAWS